MSIGDRIKQVRMALGLSGTEFGDKIGITRASISRIENNNRTVTDRIKMQICKEYNVNIEYLEGTSDEMFLTKPEEDILDLTGLNPIQKNLARAIAKLTDEDIDRLTIAFFGKTLEEMEDEKEKS